MLLSRGHQGPVPTAASRGKASLNARVALLPLHPPRAGLVRDGARGLKNKAHAGGTQAEALCAGAANLVCTSLELRKKGSPAAAAAEPASIEDAVAWVAAPRCVCSA